MRLSQTSILEGIERKEKLFGHYYENFEKHLFLGKISKASEFLWGAVCSLIYSLGLTYNKQLAKHRSMRDFINDISKENDDEEIFKLFKLSEDLHRNFYSDDLDKEGLEVKREYVDELIKKLQKLLEERIEFIKLNFVEETPEEKSDIFFDWL